MFKRFSLILLLALIPFYLFSAEINVTALRGPTAMGMVKLMKDSESGSVNGNDYDFTIEGAIDAVTPAIVRGSTDIAAVPANVSSVLYNNTDGGIEVLAINTLGVLYIAEKGDSVHSVEDLRGKTIYSSGNGATPEYALRFVLESAGLEIGRDVFIEWRSEHAECVAALEANDGAVAMLPQPFLTSALLSDSSIRVALDLNDLWMEAMGTELITGVVIARTSFIEENEDEVRAFLSSYGDSVDFVNGNISEGAALVGEYGIIGEKVANLAIPGCNITLITGEEMKAALSNYLGVLYSMNPKSVGGALPNEDYYFI
ncbi:MAG TPA: ABC transporter substrate-binding protein [Candidatus Ornithospirochaeta stercorigallinarum]|nr:ABC transporter substrate-binding protein [Candidatus Ornithospirochaeta stercorigallinarum]